MCYLHSPTVTEYAEFKILQGLCGTPHPSHTGMPSVPLHWANSWPVEEIGWVFTFALLNVCLCILLCPQIGDHKFSAHRIVLAASIPYFHAMFTNDMMECKQDEIVMQGMDPRYEIRPSVSTAYFQPCVWYPLRAFQWDPVSSTAPHT